MELPKSFFYIAVVVLLFGVSLAKPAPKVNEDDMMDAVLPSPNQEFDEENVPRLVKNFRTNQDYANQQPQVQQVAAASSGESAIPIYVSPFVRSERSIASSPSFQRQESSYSPLINVAPLRPSVSNLSPAGDLKASASYGHQHGGYHHGYGPSGWLDMGAWTGGKGSFGWYADYPVGSKHGYGK